MRAVPGVQTGPRDVKRDRTLPRLSQVMGTIRSVAADLAQAVDGLSVARATVEFGVTFSVHSGQFVAAFVDVGQECAFNVTLEWTPTA